jgi:ParB-like chromosome segregation protein Spo0J
MEELVPVNPGRIPIDQLVRGASPRVDGEIVEHTRLLAECEKPLPPIMVHRQTMRVIDGMHRLRAAIMRGDDTIEAQFFDGDESEAFVAAVQANIAHGLPLSLADREAAAARILEMYPERSDRWIASVTGLAAGTIAPLRAVATAGTAVQARVGRDGKLRPLSTAEARRAAGRLIAERPEASLREVARLSGLSPATVRDVRERVRRGDDPVPERQRDVASAHERALDLRDRPEGARGRRPNTRDKTTLLRILNRDPALRFNEAGRSLLRWLSGRVDRADSWRTMVNVVPPHCCYVVAELAVALANEWLDFAAELEQQLEDTA